MNKNIAIALGILLAACGRQHAPSPSTAADPAPNVQHIPADGAFIGKVWMSATPGRPVGSMLIFMPDRTLVMDSCFETYRLSQWGIAKDRIRWLEDSIPIEAAVELPRPNQLILKIPGRDEDQVFVAASPPYVCPDMPK